MKPSPDALPKAAKTFIIAALLLFTLAAGIRAIGVIKGPAEFQPVRQYFTALIARYLYYTGDEQLPESKRIYLEKTVQPIHEPPIMEGLSIIGFHLLGDHQDNLWLPRAIAAAAWLLGGVFLFLLMIRLLGGGAALVGAAFYLFLPFGIAQSLSFQPDSLMLAAGLAAVLAILRYHRHPSTRTMVIAALVSALAMTIKTQILFLIVGAYVGLALGRMPPLRLIRDRDSWIFAAIALTPPILYLLANQLFIHGLEAQRGMISSALLSPHFYISWIYMLEKVLGYPVLILGLLGLVVMRGDLRNLTLGLWGGYILFGLVFTYHFATHTYYHISVIPPVALGIAALAALVIESLRDQNRVYRGIGIALVSLLAIGLTSAQVVRSFDHPGIDDKAGLFAAIGERIEHSNQTIVYAQSEGLPLMYHGWISGWLWPTSWHRAVDAHGLSGIITESSEEAEQAAITAAQDDIGKELDQLRSEGARWFVVTLMEDFQEQPGLEPYLRERFQLVEESPEYMIFDLEKPVTSDRPSPGTSE